MVNKDYQKNNLITYNVHRVLSATIVRLSAKSFQSREDEKVP